MKNMGMNDGFCDDCLRGAEDCTCAERRAMQQQNDNLEEISEKLDRIIELLEKKHE